MKTILLIEDSDIIRENTAEILELAGYRVLTADNGKTGVSQALATRPDLVVCDIMMPVLDGYGVLHIFGQHPSLAGVPFIFLTAKTERADLRRGMELGADDYITKPFEEAELLSAIASRLHRVQQLRPTALPRPESPDELLTEAQALARLRDLAADRRPHFLRRKQELYAEGDEPTRLYFVQAGRVKTVRRTAAGKELITGVYGPGEFIGYLPLLAQQPHADTAVVVDDATLYYIPGEEFARLLHHHPAVGQHLARLLAGRVGEREQQLLGMAYDSLRRRVADALLRLHEQAGGAPPTGIQLSRDELAAVVGTAPESLIRTLTEFRQDGLIEQTAAGIRVLQPEQLRRARW